MQKHLTVLIIFNLALSACFAQPFQVGHKQQTFVDPSRANRNITTEIYYPANSAGNNVPIATEQFPVLVFGHGFVMTWSAYDVEWNAIVPNGYIMVFPTTETSFSPSHTDFGKDIAFLAGAMKAEGTNSSSIFFGAVAATSAVMGHSMGGGSAFLAVQYDSSITVLATLAAAVTNPSSITAAQNISIPAIVFSGANDCVAPPAQHQLPMYNSLASLCKTFVSITGGSHCQFANYNLYCSVGEGTCQPQPAISALEQQTITTNLLLPWLDYYLKYDVAAGIQFQELISAGTGITSQQNCSLLPTGIEDVQDLGHISLYPNPSAGGITVKANINLKNADFTIYNILGKEVKALRNISGREITISRDNMPCGIFYIRINEDNRTIAVEKLIITD